MGKMPTVRVMSGKGNWVKTDSSIKCENIRAEKREKKYAGHSSYRPTGDKTCSPHGAPETPQRSVKRSRKILGEVRRTAA